MLGPKEIYSLFLCDTTVWFFLYSNTNAKVQEEAEAIWKFQKYSLILDFEEKLILPPPLNFLSYIIMLIQCIVGFIRYVYRRYCKGCSTCCNKKNDSAVSYRYLVIVGL